MKVAVFTTHPGLVRHVSQYKPTFAGETTRACYELLDMVNSENEPKTVSE